LSRCFADASDRRRDNSPLGKKYEKVDFRLLQRFNRYNRKEYTLWQSLKPFPDLQSQRFYFSGLFSRQTAQMDCCIWIGWQSTKLLPESTALQIPQMARLFSNDSQSQPSHQMGGVPEDQDK
jgi:hypothetical protein